MFDKIAEVCPNGTPETYHSLSSASNGPLYLTTTKGVEQKKHSYYHHTTLTGGNLNSFVDGKWSTPTEFPEIDADENREDLIFALGAQLFMLIYSRYDAFEYRQLLHWKNNAWIPGPLATDEATKFTANRAEVAYGVDPAGKGIIVAISDMSSGTLYIDQIQIDQSGAGKVKHFSKVENQRPGWVTHVGATDTHVYAISGEEMCGFMWQPQSVLVYSIYDRKWETKETGGEHGMPPFSFAGPSSSFVNKAGEWVMIGGSSRKGMTGSSLVRDVWSLKLDDSPKWEKKGLAIPEDIGGEYTAYAFDGDKSIFLYDSKQGLYKGSF